MKPIYLKSAWKSDSFDVYFSIKILFFRVSFTNEGGSLLTTNCLMRYFCLSMKKNFLKKKFFKEKWRAINLIPADIESCNNSNSKRQGITWKKRNETQNERKLD